MRFAGSQYVVTFSSFVCLFVYLYCDISEVDNKPGYLDAGMQVSP